jgi:hypothetical protein
MNSVGKAAAIILRTKLDGITVHYSYLHELFSKNITYKNQTSSEVSNLSSFQLAEKYHSGNYLVQNQITDFFLITSPNNRVYGLVDSAFRHKINTDRRYKNFNNRTITALLAWFIPPP